MTALVRTPLAVTRTLLQPRLILCMEHVMTNRFAAAGAELRSAVSTRLMRQR